MRKNKWLALFQYVFAIFITLCTLAPFIWLILSSISYQMDLTTTPLQWFPSDPTFARYSDIATNPDNNIAFTFRIAMINSLIIAICTTLIALVVGGLAAYASARYHFAFRRKLIYMFLFTYMIPSIVIVIPLYTVLTNLGLLDSKAALVLLHSTFVIPFVIWVMQSYFGSISKEYDDAAMVDGCSRLQVLWWIMLPIVRPGLIATAILAFLLSWDEFFYGLLFTSSLDAKTISVSIAEFSGKNAVDYGMVATGGVLASVPPLIIVFALKRFLVEGLTSGGLKE